MGGFGFGGFVYTMIVWMAGSERLGAFIVADVDGFVLERLENFCFCGLVRWPGLWGTRGWANPEN